MKHNNEIAVNERKNKKKIFQDDLSEVSKSFEVLRKRKTILINLVTCTVHTRKVSSELKKVTCISGKIRK